MVALSADGTKPEVAAAKVYFAVKTRERELDEAYLQWRHRAIQALMAHGASREWAETRVDDITARNELTHEWFVRGVKGKEYAILTDQLHMGAFGLSIEEHKALKGFAVTYKGKKLVYNDDLPPAMTRTELALNTLASTAARDIHLARDSQGFQQVARDVLDAGDVAATARRRLEELTGHPVVSPRNMVKEPDGGLWGELPAPDDTEA